MLGNALLLAMLTASRYEAKSRTLALLIVVLSAAETISGAHATRSRPDRSGRRATCGSYFRSGCALDAAVLMLVVPGLCSTSCFGGRSAR
jgi:hypothetical protein